MTARFTYGLFDGREAEIETADPIITVEGIPGPMEHWTPPKVMTKQKYEIQSVYKDIAIYMAIE